MVEKEKTMGRKDIEEMKLIKEIKGSKNEREREMKDWKKRWRH